MKKAVLVKTNGSAATIDVPEDITCAWIAQNIGCEWVEVVRGMPRLGEDLILVVDEEGLLKQNKLNVGGSYMYETDKHGSPIAGDLMILREEFGEEGPEFAGIAPEEARELMIKFSNMDNLLNWYMEIKKAL